MMLPLTSYNYNKHKLIKKCNEHSFKKNVSHSIYDKILVRIVYWPCKQYILLFISLSSSWDKCKFSVQLMLRISA